MNPTAESPGTVRSLPMPRRIAGVAVVVITASLAVLFVAGVANPWRLVVLERQFGNPLLGAFVVATGVFLALWLLAPVRNEAVQRWRGQVRATVAVVGLLALFGFALFGQIFTASYDELARSDDGSQAVVLVTRTSDERQLAYVWAGSGLFMRNAGEIGRACGSVTAEFVTADLVEIEAGYGPWLIALDPETAEPLQKLGPRCPDGPHPPRPDPPRQQ